MPFIYTYDPVAGPVVFKLRRLIRDVNLDVTGLVDRRAESVFFCDEELTAFLADASGDYYGAAALALQALLADKKAMMTALRLGTYGENYQIGIEKLIEKYEALSVEGQPAMLVLEQNLTDDAYVEYNERIGDYDTEA